MNEVTIGFSRPNPPFITKRLDNPWFEITALSFQSGLVDFAAEEKELQLVYIHSNSKS